MSSKQDATPSPLESFKLFYEEILHATNRPNRIRRMRQIEQVATS